MKLASQSLFIAALLCAGSVYADEEPYDPWEGMNRGIFAFNNAVDENVAEPVARAYGDYVPSPVRTGIHNFFENISYPKYVVSDLIQLKFTQMLKHTGRFLINTTVGVGGLIDVAKEVGLEHHYEDISIAFAYHGVPAGPYLVLPFLGSSNIRDTISYGIEFFLSPWYWICREGDVSDGVAWGVGSGMYLTNFIDHRYNMLEAVSAARDASVDLYLTAQAAYYQQMNGYVRDEYVTAEEKNAQFDDDWLSGEDEEFEE